MHLSDNTKLPISVIVLTYNEEQNIKQCLDSIHQWADELFIVDSGSTDQTVQIAQQYTDSIIEHPFENYSKQRNWAQHNLPISNEWVFHIDADERVTTPLVTQLRDFFSAPTQGIAGLLVRRRIEFMGRHMCHGGIYPTYHCRIFQHALGQCEDREYDQHYLVQGQIFQIEADLTEVTASSLHSWTTRHLKWAQMEAQHLFQQAHVGTGRVQADRGGNAIERRRWLRASVYERSPIFLRAYLYFFVRFVLRGGFLDGFPGLIYHTLHGFWFRFYTDAILYELRQDSKK